jgi:hypothetical protein
MTPQESRSYTKKAHDKCFAWPWPQLRLTKPPPRKRDDKVPKDEQAVRPLRDPRCDPKPGDVVFKGKTTSTVIGIHEDGDMLSEVDGHRLKGPLKYWLTWAKDGEVIHRAD